MLDTTASYIPVGVDFFQLSRVSSSRADWTRLALDGAPFYKEGMTEMTVECIKTVTFMEEAAHHLAPG